MPDGNSALLVAAVQSDLARHGQTIGDLVRADGAGQALLDGAFERDLRDIISVDTFTPISEFLALLQRIRAAVEAKRAAFPGFGDASSDLLPGTGEGYFQHFRNGSVFWTEAFGAHEVHGAIRDRYASMGWETSYLGYPQTDELQAGEARFSNFDGGTIRWTAATGAEVAASISTRIERHTFGAWVHVSGQGFTPGATVRFAVEGLEGFQGVKSTGIFAIVRGDGRFPELAWDGRTWTRGGTATLRATEQPSGRTATSAIPALS